jgi:uncharacterized protein (TIGR02147 family)
MGEESKFKTVFEYNNYREFVRDYYLQAKSRNKTFSHRVFARLAGFKSSNFIKFIMDGVSNVSRESAEKLAHAMKLTKEETSFFCNLVSFNQSSSSEERHRWAQELLRSRTHRKIFPLREALFDYTSKWYLSVLRGLVGLPGFKEDYQFISEMLFPPLTISEIRKGFEELINLGLLQRDNKGKLFQSSANVASADEVTLSSVPKFHREMMKRASESLDRVPRNKRDISGITIGMSVELATKIKEKIQNFRKEVVEMASQTTDADAIYQLNFQLFPLVELNEDPKKVK